MNLSEMVNIVESNLHEEEYTMQEICNLLETNQQEIILNSLNQNTSHRNNEIKANYLCLSILI